jgi:beta-RFAP synthase
MLDQPGWELDMRIGTVEADQVSGPQSERVSQVLQELRQQFALASQLPPLEAVVRREIPAHCGLGSGTQLALSVARGVLALAGEALPLAQLALQLGRGQRSAIGLYGAETGGLLVDAGHRPGQALAELAVQTSLPEDWRFLLLRFAATSSPFCGQHEQQAFREIRPMTDDVSGRLARIVLTELLPAVRSAHIQQFQGALEEYGQLVGKFFEPCQGGIFADAALSSLIERLRQAGARGFAQSSWGPTIALACGSEAEARHWMEIARKETSQPLSITVATVRSLPIQVQRDAC